MKQIIISGLVRGSAGVSYVSPDWNTDFTPGFAADMQQQSPVNDQDFVNRFVATLNL